MARGLVALMLALGFVVSGCAHAQRARPCTPWNITHRDCSTFAEVGR